MLKKLLICLVMISVTSCQSKPVIIHDDLCYEGLRSYVLTLKETEALSNYNLNILLTNKRVIERGCE